jgi:hypothetical protein
VGIVIAFRVQLNRDEAVTAGLPGNHVVSVHADDHRATYQEHAPWTEAGTGLRMSVGGLRTAEGIHVSWLSRPLRVGDEITIAVLEVPESEISQPVKSGSAAESRSEVSERERLAHLLKKYAPVDG